MEREVFFLKFFDKPICKGNVILEGGNVFSKIP